MEYLHKKEKHIEPYVANIEKKQKSQNSVKKIKQKNNKDVVDWTKPEKKSPNYETDGHYSTVYLIALMLGFPNEIAKKIAYYTELPDTQINDDSAFMNYTWASPTAQEEIHSLTAGDPITERAKVDYELSRVLDEKNIDYKRLGELLHKYGDTYAHTRLDNPNKLYGEKNFFFMTTEHASVDGLEPDMIWKRPEDYIEYVGAISAYLYSIGKRMGLEMNYDNFDKKKFVNMANYAKKEKKSLIGIINYEISKYQGKDNFFIPYAQHSPDDAGNIWGGIFVTQGMDIMKTHQEHIENTKKYLDSLKIKYSTTQVFKKMFFNDKWINLYVGIRVNVLK